MMVSLRIIRLGHKQMARRILWAQVGGLAAVQGSISLTWVLYNLYLPDLLTQVGLSAALAGSILLLENLLGIVIEPLAGSFSDQRQRWVGSRLPFISLGMIASVVLFLLIPFTALSLSGLGTSPLRWLLPASLVAWAIAMTLFRSPVLSLLGSYAYESDLPQAAAVLTLVGGVVGGVAPLAQDGIRSLGAGVTFGLGSFVILGAAWILRLVNPPSANPDPERVGALEKPSVPLPPAAIAWTNLALIFGTGAGVGIGFRLMMQVLPGALTAALPGAIAPWGIGILFLSLAVTALPAGYLASRWGNARSMTVGLLTMAFLLGLVALTQTGWLLVAVAIGLGASFSLVSNGTIPFALGLVPPAKAGLGTGMYFSGGAAAASLFGVLFSTGDRPEVSCLVGAVGFLGAGVLVQLAQRWSRRVPGVAFYEGAPKQAEQKKDSAKTEPKV